MINFVFGDMFNKKYDIRVNTINIIGVMGAGIALEFKNRYPKMYQKYREDCILGLVQPGKIHIVQAEDCLIYNFPTKRHWRDKSIYEDITSGLIDLKRLLIENPEKSIAIPALGCSNGGLDWNIVAKMIFESLNGLPNVIDVYSPLNNKNNWNSIDFPENHSDWQTLVSPYLSGKPIINISSLSILNAIWTDSVRYAFAKTSRLNDGTEQSILHDSAGLEKRMFIGRLGEYACCQYLGLKFNFYFKTGNSFEFAETDLKEYKINVGIKNVKRGQFPLINIKGDAAKQTQIICITRKNGEGFDVCIAGLATPEVLSQYNDVKYVKSENVKRKGSKSGFYGFQWIQDFDKETLLTDYPVKDWSHLWNK